MKTIIEMARKYTVGGLEFDADGLKRFVDAIRADERDELLDIVYSYADNLSWNDDFQAAIRARGQA
jgi:hypothetical protein